MIYWNLYNFKFRSHTYDLPLEASPSWLDPWGNFGSPNSTATLMMEKSQTSMVDPIGMANPETEILPETFSPSDISIFGISWLSG